MKASLAEDDMILHVNFAESWRNDQQDAIQNAYLGTKSFSIFAPCCYTKPVDPDDLQNDSFVLVTGSSDDEGYASMRCLQKVLDKIEEQYEKVYDNIFVWSDGMGAQFRSCFAWRIAFMVLQCESSWERPYRPYGWRRQASVVVYTSLEFTEAVKRFVLSIHAVNLT